jgi:uncharacterized protein YcbX
MSLYVKSLYIYPIKSCAAIHLPLEASGNNTEILPSIGSRGLTEYDRNWMLVDVDGNLLSQRDHPTMALVRPTIKMGDLALNADGFSGHTVKNPSEQNLVSVTIHGKDVSVHECDSKAGEWFSDFLKIKGARLVSMFREFRRPIDPAYEPGVPDIIHHTSLADQFPYLITTEASLNALNEGCNENNKIDMSRFRPNIVIAGNMSAFDEEMWKEVQISSTLFHLVKPCARCQITSVDQLRGQVSLLSTPKVLAQYNRRGKVDGKPGVFFGMYAVTDNPVLETGFNIINNGDPVIVMSRRDQSLIRPIHEGR